MLKDLLDILIFDLNDKVVNYSRMIIWFEYVKLYFLK